MPASVQSRPPTTRETVSGHAGCSAKRLPAIASSACSRRRSGRRRTPRLLRVQIGLVGSGNIARALALGWGEPVLCTDSGSGRAQELAALVGGQAVGSNRELAERADLVVRAALAQAMDDVVDFA
jgi:phosphoglycerate dehydrogenase-like enzyme